MSLQKRPRKNHMEQFQTDPGKLYSEECASQESRPDSNAQEPMDY